MKSLTILDISDIRDEEGRIRSRFPQKGDLDFRPNGRYLALRSDGKPLLEITYRDGVVHGPYEEYWSNGKLACSGQFNEGKQEGTWRFYCEDGISVMEAVHFSKGKEVR